MNYRQCELTQVGDGGALTQRKTVGWIDAEAAKIGWRMKLPDTNEPGVEWEVTAMWPFTVTGEELKEKQRMDRKGFASTKG